MLGGFGTILAVFVSYHIGKISGQNGKVADLIEALLRKSGEIE